jgi:glycosyltransferase involved in cell wall biosynthesis
MLVPFHDPLALCDAVETLLVDPALTMRVGRAARELVAKGYSTEVMVDAVARLYQELTLKKRSLVNAFI